MHMSYYRTVRHLNLYCHTLILVALPDVYGTITPTHPHPPTHPHTHSHLRTVKHCRWDGTGFQLNSEHVKLRGFSHHNSMAGMGVALAPRIYLFRAQASRALGANIWRNSHNPYPSSLYGVLDRLGVMCWDEIREYGAKYWGGAYAVAMRDMVKAHRNSPSIVTWSTCNEGECIQVRYYCTLRNVPLLMYPY
jgi:beta-galactosidase/beta-glucuronidase